MSVVVDVALIVGLVGFMIGSAAGWISGYSTGKKDQKWLDDTQKTLDEYEEKNDGKVQA